VALRWPWADIYSPFRAKPDRNNPVKARTNHSSILIVPDLLTATQFNEIAGRYDVENIEKLLKDLHYLGVSLWYKDMEEFDTLVLNPEWINHGIYKIINWVNEEKKHSLTLDDFATVFKEDKDRYPEDKHNFLIKLMKHYELAYETKGGMN